MTVILNSTAISYQHCVYSIGMMILAFIIVNTNCFNVTTSTEIHKWKSIEKIVELETQNIFPAKAPLQFRKPLDENTVHVHTCSFSNMSAFRKIFMA